MGEYERGVRDALLWIEGDMRQWPDGSIAPSTVIDLALSHMRDLISRDKLANPVTSKKRLLKRRK